MSTIKKLIPSAKYQSNTHKVSSRNLLSINRANYTTVKTGRFSGLNENLNLTIKKKSLLDSLNLMTPIYIYIDECPDSNVIYYDSNLKKYRTLSSSVKKSFNSKTFNINQKKDLDKNFKNSTQIKTNIQNKYLINKSMTNSGINQTQKINRTLNFIKTDFNDKNKTISRTNISAISNLSNKYQIPSINNNTNTYNKNNSTINKSENKRLNLFSNRQEQKTGFTQINPGYNIQVTKSLNTNNSINTKYNLNNKKLNLIPTNRVPQNNQTNQRIQTNYITQRNQSAQMNQGRRTYESDTRKMILNKIQNDKINNRYMGAKITNPVINRNNLNNQIARMNNNSVNNINNNKTNINTNMNKPYQANIINKTNTSTNMNRVNLSSNIIKPLTSNNMNRVNINTTINKPISNTYKSTSVNKVNANSSFNKVNTSNNMNRINLTTNINKNTTNISSNINRVNLNSSIHKPKVSTTVNKINTSTNAYKQNTNIASSINKTNTTTSNLNKTIPNNNINKYNQNTYNNKTIVNPNMNQNNKYNQNTYTKTKKPNIINTNMNSSLNKVNTNTNLNKISNTIKANINSNLKNVNTNTNFNKPGLNSNINNKINITSSLNKTNTNTNIKKTNNIPNINNRTNMTSNLNKVNTNITTNMNKTNLSNTINRTTLNDNKNNLNNQSVPKTQYQSYQQSKIYQEDIINQKNTSKENLETSKYKSPININTDIQRESQISQIQPQFQYPNTLQSPKKNEEIIKDENGEIIQKKEEKTIIVLPGQTMERKSVTETLENPVIEAVLNEDGTTKSIIKQTKIITTVENIPIIADKYRYRKHEHDLPLYKQIITHEYKTVSAVKDKFGENSENKNNEKDEDNEVKENYNDSEDNINEKKGEENDKNDEDIPKNKIVGKDADKIKALKDNKDNKMRYMDIVGEENYIKDNKTNIKKENTLGKNKKQGNKNSGKNTSGFTEKVQINQENKETKENNIKQKSNVKDAPFGKGDNLINSKTKGESLSKSKAGKAKINDSNNINTNLKSSVNDNKKITKKDDKKPSPFGINELTEKNKTSRQGKNNSGASKSKEKNNTNTLNSKKELNAIANTSNPINNLKVVKNEEKVDLRKNIRISKKEEIDSQKGIESGITLKDIKNNSGKMKIITDLYEKCIKSGKKGSENNMDKLIEILILIEENPRKEILSKLLKLFPKSGELNQKILTLIIQKQQSIKSKEKNNKLNLNKKEKETRSLSQKKSGSKKINLERELSSENKSDNNRKIKHDDRTTSLPHNDRQGLYTSNNIASSMNAANIAILKFDGLFLDISKYVNTSREKNPFEGPSSFEKFYKERKTKIKNKIISMANEGKNENEEN